VSYGPVSVSVSANVSNDTDINKMAYRIAEIIQWRKR
jgi:hypothetical protein